MSGGRVIVVGSVNVDLVVRAERLPVPGETVTGGRFARHHGGKGGNQAVAAARVGATTSIVAAFGDDAFGREARAALAREGVDVSEVATLPGETTGVALVVVAPGGENQIAVASGANGHVGPDLVGRALARLAPGPGDVVLVGHEIPTAAVHLALSTARERGATAILNPAPAHGLDAPVVGLAAVVTPNRGELAVLAGDGEPERVAGELLARGAGAVLVSLGAAGALLVRPEGSPLPLPAPRVATVDATGAGDALNGVLAAGLAAGLVLEAAARRAVVAATLSTRVAGAREGLPRAADLD